MPHIVGQTILIGNDRILLSNIYKFIHALYQFGKNRMFKQLAPIISK